MSASPVAVARWTSAAGVPVLSERQVPEEAAVALVYAHATYAVMMASPADLGDFALGFSLAEGLVDGPDDIEELEIVPHAGGIELRMQLGPLCAARPRERARRMAGPAGCGLCGVQSLAEVFRPLPQVAPGFRIEGTEIFAAMGAMVRGQRLNAVVRATHAAAFWQPGHGLIALREDVGRHNALDKLAGALAFAGTPGASGVVLLSSRVSIEMVQKAARMGAAILVAASAPTALAVRMAGACGITLVGVARSDGFEVFTALERIDGPTHAD